MDLQAYTVGIRTIEHFLHSLDHLALLDNPPRCFPCPALAPFSQSLLFVRTAYLVQTYPEPRAMKVTIT